MFSVFTPKMNEALHKARPRIQLEMEF